jgi:hypothetical protein
MKQQPSQQRGKDMSHLSEEQLDQIVAEERLREQAPLNEWRTIAARAREEGLIVEAASSRGWGGASVQPWLQAAAALLILVGGIAIGRTTIGLPSALQNVAGNQTTSVTAGASKGVVNTPTNGAPSNATFASVDDAAATLDRAVLDYQRASQFIAASSATPGSRDSATIYTRRAAALDEIANATENALQTAPHDPVINQYYLATMGARVATRQLVATPVGLKGF